jgi:hypothetical protein
LFLLCGWLTSADRDAGSLFRQTQDPLSILNGMRQIRRAHLKALLQEVRPYIAYSSAAGRGYRRIISRSNITMH